ncbi:MAG: hypothetical protein ACK4MV_07235 [Beijerinckiaceae bacterium]
MSVENVTASRGYQLPYPDNDLSFDVGRIIAAINGLDVDVATLIASLSGKAATTHTHAINDVSGLQAALDGKIGTGTELPISQVTNLQAALDAKAPINNAAFTGTTTGVSPSAGANNTQFATTAWVRTQAYLTSVATANIADGAVTEMKIAAGAVTEARLGASAVTESKIAAGSVTEPKIATGAVTVNKIGDGAISFIKVASAALATVSEFLSQTASKILTADRVWSAAVPVAISYSATLTPNFAGFINARTTLTGNATLGQPTNVKKGQMGVWEFQQDATGSRTLSYNTAYWKAAPGFSLSTAANATDYVSMYGCDDGKVLLSIVKNPA